MRCRLTELAMESTVTGRRSRVLRQSDRRASLGDGVSTPSVYGHPSRKAFDPPILAGHRRDIAAPESPGGDASQRPKELPPRAAGPAHYRCAPSCSLFGAAAHERGWEQRTSAAGLQPESGRTRRKYANRESRGHRAACSVRPDRESHCQILIPISKLSRRWARVEVSHTVVKFFLRQVRDQFGENKPPGVHRPFSSSVR